LATVGTLAFLALAALLAIPLARPVSAEPQARMSTTATYTVNSNASDADATPGDGVCATSSGACTLHAAIQEANADGVDSLITFASKFQGLQSIPGCPSNLPDITGDGTIIDASDQWDTANNRPGVEITGSSCDILTITADDTMILGLLFSGGSATGIHIKGGAFNFIGDTGPGQRNVFLTGKWGIHVESLSPQYIVNNYFGTADGETLPGGGVGERGVFVYGGPTYIISNLIVGQSDAGIYIWGDYNEVRENIIGINQSKTISLPNTIGVYLAAADYNVVSSGNVIAGNSSHGVYLYHADHNTIAGNYIGYATTGLKNGGDGIHIFVSVSTLITGANTIGPNAGNGIQVKNSNDVVIQGNSIANNDGDGVYVYSSSDVRIGGTGDARRNSINSNGGNGIHLDASNHVTVTNNYIGLGQGAYDQGNQGHGILIEKGSTDNTIGGIGPGEGNWIGWNRQDGIRLDGSTTHSNDILGNVIGAPVNWGWKAPNHHHGIGIYNGAHDNAIGWGLLGGNTILANGWSGVAIVGSDDNAVLGNSIGTNGRGANWGNAFYGVHVVNSSGTSIRWNEIAYNGTHNGTDGAEAGVFIDGSTAVNNLISENSIHDNDGPGIKLANGGNHNLAPPTITSASCSSVQGTACPNCYIEIYSDNGDEGRIYEGHFTTDPSGNFSWKGTLHGPNATALAIGPGSAQDTSPFSAPFTNACNRIYLPLTMRNY